MMAREWEEELIAEWLSLQGYLVQTNVPLRAPKVGGRAEADVIGVKALSDGRLEIWHIEIGSLLDSFEKNLERIKNKFSEERCDAVIKYVKLTLGEAREIANYRKTFVATYCSRVEELGKMLKKEETGIELLLLQDIVKQEIPTTIHQWKERQEKIGLVKDRRNIVLPRSYWLLKVIELLLR
ncbi:MAG: hypothetical protein J7J04_06255 [Thermococcus sp.]|nr:hypothetical protein [Thermococcus sp.]